MLTRRLPIVAAMLLALACPPAVQAQSAYFGRNKVQYQNFKFQVLKTEHFDIYFYPEEEAAARMAGRMAERWYARLSAVLTHQLRGRQPLILYASGPHFRETNAIEGDIGEGTGGVTEAYKRRIVLPFAGPIEATDHVLGHELVHAFQYDITNTNASSGNAGALAMPLWFIEGMAEYLSVGPVDPLTAMWMREAARREKLPDVDDLDNPRYFPYRYGQALWAYIGGKYGDKAVGQMLRATIGNGTYRDAIQGILGIDTKTLSRDWHNAEFAAYRPVAEATQMPAEFARTVIHTGERADLNVGPELSPDGTRFMFFSSRDLFSIDLYLADAKTGEVIKKITDTSTSAHFESLQFLTSAGAWSGDGKQFVFPGISKGHPVLDIVDVDRGSIAREIDLKDIDEVLNPSWSPDGRRIAFSGLVGGYNDLFVYDLTTDALKRLTHDAFAEMDPAWAPDSRRIAFSTDRYTTNTAGIVPGPFRIAVIDADTGDVREVGGFPGAKNIGPQWTDDGTGLFFLSDRQGITNIYRMGLDGSSPRQLTNLLTGASGITELSPAMSVANGRLLFSAYENDGYSIYALDTPEALAGMPPVDLPLNAAVLPPRREGSGPVYAAIHNMTIGLPAETEMAAREPEPYRAKLSLDFAGQPTFAVGVDPFGTYAAGGISLLFSDMLGNHLLATTIQATSRFDEFGGQVFYLNRQHRWNWGVSLEAIPYVSRSFAAGLNVVNGQTVYQEDEFRFLQRDMAATGLVQYPFSRSQRVEMTGGFRRISFTQDVTSRYYDPFSGQPLGKDQTDLGSTEALNLGQASGAWVFDTSLFGITSPIRGSRARVELSQNTGSLTFTGVLADMRTYLMPVRPFTFALRGLFYGRYGTDSGDFRLPTLYLGYPGLVRGYDSGSFEAGECGLQPDGSCPAFDRLIGSRLGVANAELRFPLWSLFRPGEFYGPLPVEMAVFSDAGVAWGTNTHAFVAGSDSHPVVSAGVAARINVFNFAVAEIDYVRPFDRPGRGWLWQFNLIPGF